MKSIEDNNEMLRLTSPRDGPFPSNNDRLTTTKFTTDRSVRSSAYSEQKVEESPDKIINTTFQFPENQPFEAPKG